MGWPLRWPCCWKMQRDRRRTEVGSAVGRGVGFAVGPGEGKGVGIAKFRRCMCSLILRSEQQMGLDDGHEVGIGVVRGVGRLVGNAVESGDGRYVIGSAFGTRGG